MLLKVVILQLNDDVSKRFDWMAKMFAGCGSRGRLSPFAKEFPIVGIGDGGGNWFDWRIERLQRIQDDLGFSKWAFNDKVWFVASMQKGS
jgi:hypothetical protein